MFNYYSSALANTHTQEKCAIRFSIGIQFRSLDPGEMIWKRVWNRWIAVLLLGLSLVFASIYVDVFTSCSALKVFEMRNWSMHGVTAVAACAIHRWLLFSPFFTSNRHKNGILNWTNLYKWACVFNGFVNAVSMERKKCLRWMKSNWNRIILIWFAVDKMFKKFVWQTRCMSK